MKTCGECGEVQGDAAKFCAKCGFALDGPIASAGLSYGSLGETKEVPVASKAVSAGPVASKASITADAFGTKIIKGATAAGSGLLKSADIMFVLDCTGSMAGEINAMRNAITGFADTIRTEKVRARVGLIEFRDRLNGEEQHLHRFGGEVFTDDPAAFRKEAEKLSAHGGGDEPESSLDALLLATKQPFSESSAKVIVLVTDAPPHIPDKEVRSIEEVADAFSWLGVNQFYMVIRTDDQNSRVYLRLLEKTRGMAFELGKGNDFKGREDHFQATLKALGLTISNATKAG